MTEPRTLTAEERHARARAIDALSGASTQAVLTIDLDALAHNWRLLSKNCSKAECGAVVKADAYGVGIEFAVPALARAGCRTFFVAHVSEGIRVRERLGTTGARIFVLNGLLPDPLIAPLMLQHRLTPVIGSIPEWRFWRDAEGTRNTKIALHIDLGMNRLGVPADDLAALAGDARLLENLSLIIGHFISSEAKDDPLNARQIAAFATARATFPHVSASLANSSGIFLADSPHHDLVRPGYALYGGNPTPDAPNPMRHVATLEAPIIQVREVGVGATAGYNARWTAQRPSRLATIGIGYADGLPRSAMAIDTKPVGGEAIVGGVRCSFAGRVSMDLTVLDATDAPPDAVRPGAVARLLGADITVDDLAARAGTIGYEILTNLGRRYQRVYIGG